MSCGITDLTGCVGDVVGSAVSSVWDNICKSFGNAATSMLQSFGSAFASPNTGAVDLGSDGVHSVYALSLGIAGVVAALLLLFQVLRTVWTHEGSAMAQGLIGVGKAALAFLTTIGVTTAAVKAADDISEYIVKQGFGTDAALGKKLGGLFAGDLGSSPTLLMLMALLGIIITVVLWFELLVRSAAITVIVATSPIAAAGQVNDSTKSWWGKLVAAGAQLIMLKPVIALVFMLGFKISTQSSGVQQTLAGLLILLMAVFAWPSVARFFTFASVAVGGTAGLGGLLGFASGRAAAMADATGSGAKGGGGLTTDFSQSAEARTTAAKSALGMGPGAGGSGAASAGADGAKPGAMGKASTALAAAGSFGVALAGAKAAQGAINAVSGRMEQMAGHAGLSNASPHHQAAGAIPQQGARQGRQPGGDGRQQRTNQTIAEQQTLGALSDPLGHAEATSGERNRPEPTNYGAGYEAEEIPERAELAVAPSDPVDWMQHDEGVADYAAHQSPTRSPEITVAPPASVEPRSAQAPTQRAEQQSDLFGAARRQQGPPAADGPGPQVDQDTASRPPTAQPRTTDVNPQGKEKDQ